MLEIVDLFREKGTVDDLGYGIVRDVISDVLFPGVSVLHTRPRYLLLIGWIYSGLLDAGVAGQRAVDRGRQMELGLSQTFLDAGETEGVIGRVAGKRLKRLPSGAYWAALRTYGLLRIDLSLENYCRSIPSLRRSDVVLEEGQGNSQKAWNLPSAPLNFPDLKMTLALSVSEAHYLYERIMAAAGNTYLGWLLNSPIDSEATHPWTHTAAVQAPNDIRRALEIAEHYALSQHGPSLLYNLLVARTAHREELIGEYERLLNEWAAGMALRFPVPPYPLDDLWNLTNQVGARITPATRNFITWTLEMSDQEREGLAFDSEAAQRIEAREFSLKGSLSRLRGGRSLDGWSGASGTGLLEYRWQSVQPMVRDIVRSREASHA